MADLPTVPTLHHHHAHSISEYTITTPATLDPSLAPVSADDNPLLYPRKFDLINDSELYIHENRKIPRLFYYEPAEAMQISRVKMIKDGHFVGHPRTLALSVAGAVSPLQRDEGLDFGFGSSHSSKQSIGEQYRAAYSVNFGPKSQYNSTGKVKETSGKIEMQKVVELVAACEALEFVERQGQMRVFGFQDVCGEVAPGGLVVAITSSTNLWYGITEHIVGFSFPASVW